MFPLFINISQLNTADQGWQAAWYGRKHWEVINQIWLNLVKVDHGEEHLHEDNKNCENTLYVPKPEETSSAQVPGLTIQTRNITLHSVAEDHDRKGWQ